MFFVFLGLIILVLSFLVALVSLIRDSGKVSKKDLEVREPEVVSEEPAPPAESVEDVSPVQAPVTTDAILQQEQELAPIEGASEPNGEASGPLKEPFLWEKDEVVEESKEEKLPWEAPKSPKHGATIEKLNGEISLKNLKK